MVKDKKPIILYPPTIILNVHTTVIVTEPAVVVGGSFFIVVVGSGFLGVGLGGGFSQVILKWKFMSFSHCQELDQLADKAFDWLYSRVNNQSEASITH